MNAAARLFGEYRKLGGVLHTTDFARLLIYTAICAPSILRDRKLISVDNHMSLDIEVNYRSNKINIPCRKIDDILLPTHDHAVFATIREMIGNDVYLRPFNLIPVGGNVLDLGANRGVFTTLAKHVMSARMVVGVEPVAKYIPVFNILCEANDIDPKTAPREIAFIASQASEGKITVAHIAEKYGIAKIDFLKCDIEGGEYDIFLSNNEWIDCVQNVAMELHGNSKGNQSISRVLERAGLTVLTTNQFGRAVVAERAEFLYAARDAASLREAS